VTGSRVRTGAIASFAAVAASFALPAVGVANKPHTTTAKAQVTHRASSPRRTFFPTRMSSVPASAQAGKAYKLTTKVVNHGNAVRKATYKVRLMKAGSKPIVVGTTAVAVEPHRSDVFDVSVTLPKGLSKGSYSVVGCVPRGTQGWLECITAAKHVEVGTASRAAKAPVRRSADETCTSGARTLSQPGDRVYPEMGNGGYISTHTDVHLTYDAPSNAFLSGTHVDLTQVSTQCLKDFSLDFETKSPTGASTGPNMTVSSVEVNGKPASFQFKQPTYPGDPNGQDDPDPNAHLTGQTNPVTAAINVPPACSPGGTGAALQGQPCPANKLVITPSDAIPTGSQFVVTVNYTGNPGLHVDGDGSTEGWFKNGTDGSFVTTEPVGTEDWMPLNNHPTAKPTYDFYDTVNLGKQAIANGELVSSEDNPNDTTIPGGTSTWHWHNPEHVANYLITNSIGSYDLSQRLSSTGAQAGVVYYEAQASSITATKKATNKAIMDTQQDITDFQSQFNGKFPFSTNGVIIGIPSASFEEEMQTKITFAGGSISSGTFNHENMHQWWGDNVSESKFSETFLKEGWATVGEYLNTARNVSPGNLGPGDAGFETSLINRFNTNYNATSSSTWTGAPSNPTAGNLFSTANTYTRPGTAYLALRQIVGGANWVKAMQRMQSLYGGGNFTEDGEKAVFKALLPNQSTACQSKLDQFFVQWFDTAYPTPNNATNKPQITGPGLAGPGFYDATGACSRADVPTTTASFSPAQVGGYYSNPTVTLTASTPGGAGTTYYSLDGAGYVAYTAPVKVTGDGSHTLKYYSTDASGNQEPSSTTTFAVDGTAPTTTATVTPNPVNGAIANGPATVTLSATDALAGVNTTSYAVDGGAPAFYTGPITVSGGGQHVVSYASLDKAGNVEATKSVSFQIQPATSVEVGGNVQSTLGLSLGNASPTASLGTFAAGVAADYTATLPATVTSTGGNATLTVTDPSGNAAGHLVNGAYAMPQALQVAATGNGATSPAFAALGGSPLTLLSYTAPVSNDPVTLWLKQSIGKTDALRTGKYGKTLVFTLSTTQP